MPGRNKLITVILLLHLRMLAFSQDLKDSYLTLPVTFDFQSRGIPTQLILDSVHFSPSGSQAFFRIAFQHPNTKTWIWFIGTKVPFSNDGFFSNFFEIDLFEKHDYTDTLFLDALFTRNSQSRRFKWKCDCPNELPKILL